MSHRSTIYNDRAREEFVDQFGELFNSWNEAIHESRGLDGASEKQVYGSSGTERNLLLGYFLKGVPTEELGNGFRDVLNYYKQHGVTSFGSRLGHPLWISAFYNLFRREGRLPVRFGYSLEVSEQVLPEDTVLQLYTIMGTQWEGPNSGSSRWLWEHGVSSEGAWDSVQRACLGPDLDAVSDAAKDEEACIDITGSQQQVLQNGLEEGYRLVGVHMVGSHGARLFARMIQNAIEDSATLTKEKIQNMRAGGAHGTMIGKVPEVMQLMSEYNIFVPINVARALEDEPSAILDRYGEEALQFLAPVNTLLNNGVKVVGETEALAFSLSEGVNPSYYFEHINAYVNRVAPGTDQWVPEESITKVQTLKLLTIRGAEFLHAEERVGSIEPGKLADFVVIQNDILEASNDEITENMVIGTGLEGELEHQTSELEGAIEVGTGPSAFEEMAG